MKSTRIRKMRKRRRSSNYNSVSVFFMIISLIFMLLSCNRNNSFDGKYVIEDARLLITGDIEDKTSYYNDCIGKEIVIKNNTFVYSDTLCEDFSNAHIKEEYMDLKTLESVYPEDFISLIKGNYKVRGVLSIRNEKTEVYKRLDDKLLIYQDPYLLILKKE